VFKRDLSYMRMLHYRPTAHFQVFYPQEPTMADVIFVGVVIATFAVLALVVKGVERLER
jgi:hypothetical protein